MRKSITFKIEGYEKSFMVQELTIGELIGLMQGDVLTGTDIADLKTVFVDVLLPMCTNITVSEFTEMAPSEIEVAWNHFKEMNKSFFEMARKMGLTEILQDLKKAAIVDFGKLFAVLPKQDITTS